MSKNKGQKQEVVLTDGKNERVSVQEQDFLEEDQPVRGQKYVCMSFLSPEDIMQNKDVFYLNKFFGKLSTDLSAMFTQLKEKYTDCTDLIGAVEENYDYVKSADAMASQFDFFKASNSDSLEAEFHEANQFRTTLRGIKVRGSYETRAEAENRCKSLKSRGDKFDIFVGRVGFWCPWSPYADDIKDQEYTETTLNTMMKKYNENMEKRDEYFAARKADKLKNVKTRTTPTSVMDDIDTFQPSKESVTSDPSSSVNVPVITDSGLNTDSTDAAVNEIVDALNSPAINITAIDGISPWEKAQAQAQAQAQEKTDP